MLLFLFCQQTADPRLQAENLLAVFLPVAWQYAPALAAALSHVQS
jgi:hypothetical protein